ncbi:hypothetical protein ACU686_28100 [Yinghuangia aomiensis]
MRPQRTLTTLGGGRPARRRMFLTAEAWRQNDRHRCEGTDGRGRTSAI